MRFVLTRRIDVRRARTWCHGDGNTQGRVGLGRSGTSLAYRRLRSPLMFLSSKNNVAIDFGDDSDVCAAATYRHPASKSRMLRRWYAGGELESAQAPGTWMSCQRLPSLLTVSIQLSTLDTRDDVLMPDERGEEDFSWFFYTGMQLHQDQLLRITKTVCFLAPFFCLILYLRAVSLAVDPPRSMNMVSIRSHQPHH